MAGVGAKAKKLYIYKTKVILYKYIRTHTITFYSYKWQRKNQYPSIYLRFHDNKGGNEGETNLLFR